MHSSPTLGLAVTLLVLSAAGAGAQQTMACLDPVLEPPAGKALVNLHRTTGPGQISVWQGDRFLTLLAAGTTIQVQCDPGEHLFIGSFGEGGRKGGLLARVEAGKSYDVLVKVNLALGVSLVPVKRGSRTWERAPRLLEKACLVEMMFPGMPEMSVGIDPPIDEVIRRFSTGEWRGRLAMLDPGDGR